MQPGELCGTYREKGVQLDTGQFASESYEKVLKAFLLSEMYRTGSTVPGMCWYIGIVISSVVDPNKLNSDLDPEL